MACGLRQTGFASTAGRYYGIRARKRAEAPKERGPAIVTGPSIACSSAFGNDRRRRGFALADSVRLCGGRNAKESQRSCRQYSECFHGTLLCHDKRKSITGRITPPLVLKRHTLDLVAPPITLPIDRNSEICRIFAIGKRHVPNGECEQAESGLSTGIRKSVDYAGAICSRT
jgi:hypothetical protein